MDLTIKENVEEPKMDESQQKITKFDGTLVLYPNPCLSEPCLPGQVYALLYNNVHYILTNKNKWLWGTEKFIWSGEELIIGESISVEGILSEHTDIKQVVYHQLDIKYVKN